MKTHLFRWIAFILVLWLVSPVFADMSVALPQVNVTDIPVGTPTTVTISAMIGVDPRLQIANVRLVQYDPATNKVLWNTQMYDDGTHGDALPGDTRFTAQVVLNVTNPGPIQFRVTAAYSGVRNRYMSDVIELGGFVPLTTEDFETADDVMNWAMDLFDSYSQTMPPEEAAQQTLDALRSDPDVWGASICDNWLVMGLSSGILQVFNIRDDGDIDGFASPSLLSGITPLLLSTINVEKTPGNNKLLIWAPGYSDGQNAIADHAQARFQNAAFFASEPSPPVITSNASADLENVKTFGSYGTIIMHTHGGWISNDDTWFWPWEWFDKWVCLLSGTADTTANRQTYAIDLAQHRLLPNGSHGRLVFTPKFISTYVGSMPDSFIYIGACESLHDDNMWNAFKSKGAKVGFGWSKSVCRPFNTDTFESLIDAMVPTSDTVDPKTAKEAYDSITDKLDDNYSGCSENAQFTMRPNDGSTWQNMYLVTPDIINGGFETGDFKGWTTGGDYHYAVVTSHSHADSYSGALGRWDQSYHGYDPSAEPYGTEWLYQDVVVPSNATKLAFWYDIETYDTAVWDWVDMQIRDENGSVLTTVLSHAGKPGTNYGPYWHLGWTYVETDVTAYRGQKIRIYFDQRLDGYGDQQRCYFDEVKFIKQ